MSWDLGLNKEDRDIGYGVPAVCDHPDCNAVIDRGLPHACGDMHDGGEEGCGLYFCRDHLHYGLFGSARMTEDQEEEEEENRDCSNLCERCYAGESQSFKPKPDVLEWVRWKLEDPSWSEWRRENPIAVNLMKMRVSKEDAHP